VIIARRGTEESVVGSGSRTSGRRKTVKKVSGSMESLSPEAGRDGGLKKKSA